MAIVHGTSKKWRNQCSGGRNPNNESKWRLIKGKAAVTHFTVLEQFKNYSLVKCVLETGRNIKLECI